MKKITSNGTDIWIPVVVAQGETWNVKATADYIAKVYREENIIKSPDKKTGKCVQKVKYSSLK